MPLENKSKSSRQPSPTINLIDQLEMTAEQQIEQNIVIQRLKLPEFLNETSVDNCTGFSFMILQRASASHANYNFASDDKCCRLLVIDWWALAFIQAPSLARKKSANWIGGTTVENVSITMSQSIWTWLTLCTKLLSSYSHYMHKGKSTLECYSLSLKRRRNGQWSGKICRFAVESRSIVEKLRNARIVTIHEATNMAQPFT